MASTFMILSLGSSLLFAGQSAATAISTRASTLQWGNCTTLNTTLPVQCAKLPVPLDYTNASSNATLELDLIRYPATNGPSKGSVLLNFGGPGQDGLNSMLGYAPIQSPVLGGKYDLVSWDPRGTGNTLLFDCWSEIPQYATLMSDLGNSSDTAYGRLWAEAGAVAEQCYAQLNQTGDLVGMAFVARDMMQIVDALGEDGLLRYWGISGGTALGSTVAAMFPDRMERVLLDGVMNVHQYYNGYETEMLASTDAAWLGFIAACIDNPTVCPLAANHTVASLTSELDALFDRAKYAPDWLGPILLDYSLLKTYIVTSLYRPSAFHTLAAALDAFIKNNGTQLTAILGSTEPTPSQAQAVLGIRCGDKVPRATESEELRGVFDEYFGVSERFGDIFWTPYNVVCARWGFEAKERYLGDFNVKTKNPILFTGSPYDPVTPFVSAANMSASFPGSGLVKHNGYGHTSIADPSNCTNAIIERYFDTGAIPANGTFCDPNLALFADEWLESAA